MGSSGQPSEEGMPKVRPKLFLRFCPRKVEEKEERNCSQKEEHVKDLDMLMVRNVHGMFMCGNISRVCEECFRGMTCHTYSAFTR